MVQRCLKGRRKDLTKVCFIMLDQHFWKRVSVWACTKFLVTGNELRGYQWYSDDILSCHAAIAQDISAIRRIFQDWRISANICCSWARSHFWKRTAAWLCSDAGSVGFRRKVCWFSRFSSCKLFCMNIQEMTSQSKRRVIIKAISGTAWKAGFQNSDYKWSFCLDRKDTTFMLGFIVSTV